MIPWRRGDEAVRGALKALAGYSGCPPSHRAPTGPTGPINAIGVHEGPLHGNGHRVASPRTAAELAAYFTYAIAQVRLAVERIEAADAERESVERGRSLLSPGLVRET